MPVSSSTSRVLSTFTGTYVLGTSLKCRTWQFHWLCFTNTSQSDSQLRFCGSASLDCDLWKSALHFFDLQLCFQHESADTNLFCNSTHQCESLFWIPPSCILPCKFAFSKNLQMHNTLLVVTRLCKHDTLMSKTCILWLCLLDMSHFSELQS